MRSGSPTSFGSPKTSIERREKEADFARVLTTTSPNTESEREPISSAEERDLLLR